MKENLIYFTAGEFAKLHHINKRTLHYYDSVGIFSPKHKGENGYRYYTYSQSIDLENILALRELNMSIEEIQNYIKNPNALDFQNIAKKKISEIDNTISQLKKLKNILKQKSKSLDLCKDVYDGKIELVHLNEEFLLMTPLVFETHSCLMDNSNAIIKHLKASWEFSNYKKSCGSYISLEKIKKNEFNEYDGIFTEIGKKRKELYLKPAGLYIRGFCVGNWNKLPELYENILIFANKKNLTLGEYAFECGLNEFAISSEDQYITQVEILCHY
ncbi:MerR family transcriptional regulator [Romboutsia ilealis]|uniref:MerR family transcriptional regulator n=1 Tax=Romboutsia ilealis TaxID=1115758 RepID=UPI0025740549|nr:MerR family transcriptional regulator [Romboutsia ilealis]